MLQDDAFEYIKTHNSELISRFASLDEYPAILNPEAFFMAGSPGAGKTEYSRRFIKLLEEKDDKRKIVRIDADEIRGFIPMYDKHNSDLVQRAAVKGVDILLNKVFDKDQEFLLDATFAVFGISYKNIARALKHGRKISIFYIHQDPLKAWQLTQIRENIEGRKVPKDVFIKAYFNAKENVSKIKAEFGKEVTLTLIDKNYSLGAEGLEKTFINIDSIDNYLKMKYNTNYLEENLKVI